MKTIQFDPQTGLVPCIIQDLQTNQVLMLGYMNQAAIDSTLASKKVTFYSRSKQRLWVKGETSGNWLTYISMALDCDQDALLIKVLPHGPTCHTGSTTCWNETALTANDVLFRLEKMIASRINFPVENSYISTLVQKGINKVAQKVGEEAVEVVIEAKDTDRSLFLNESADLLFHLLILIQVKGFSISDVLEILKSREK